MYMQQDMQPKLSSSGYGLCKVEEDTARVDSKFQIGSRTSFSKGELVQSNSRDRLVYLTTCLIGHPVEVQVLDGSVFSGVFHATNAEDFGIVLKMARPIKDGSQGQKNISDSPNKPPSRTLIIPAKDLVQVIAKDVPITRDGFTNELQNEKQQDLMTDYCISRSGHVEAGRELERWVPDENDPGCPELENIFDGPWNRGWDQFEANETLFGVKSTFNEELYTTKLERGHQMRELEREALRIAREIEGEETHDLHLAEERGIQLDGYVEIDEETRFSSVYRGNDDSGYDEIEIILLNSRNDETIGGVSGSGIGKTRTDMSSQKASDETQLSLRSSLMGGSQSSLTATRVVHHSRFEGDSEHVLEHSSVIDSNRVHDDKLIGHPGTNYLNEDKEKQKLHDQSLVSKGSRPLLGSEKASCGKAGLSPNATAFDPSHVSSRTRENLNSSNELSVDNEPRDMQATESSLAHLSSFASRTSDHEGAPPNSNDHGLSSGSSARPFSSEKSTINPHAKEFKLNANADSFIPSQTPLRASSPVADSPFYYPATMTAVTHVHGMPVGVEIGPSFDAQQPVLFCPRAAPVAQPYYHPNGPQYGQQMIVGQLHPGLYMPTYPPEMQYK